VGQSLKANLRTLVRTIAASAVFFHTSPGRPFGGLCRLRRKNRRNLRNLWICYSLSELMSDLQLKATPVIKASNKRGRPDVIRFCYLCNNIITVEYLRSLATYHKIGDKFGSGRLDGGPSGDEKMNREELLYLIPYVFSLALSAGIFIYTWQHRHVRGATPFAWFVGGQTLYILGFIFEMISPGLEAKILWDKFQWLAETMIVIISFMLFAVNFTEFKFSHPRLAWAIILFFPAAFTILLATDGIHHLIYPNPHVNPPQPFSELKYDFTYVVYLYALYIYGVTFYGIGLLVRGIFQKHNLYRFQLIGISLGFSIPIVLSFLALFGIEVVGQRDIGPIAFGVGNLIVALALFRFRMFEVIPIARDSVVENLADPVIVFDMQSRVVDLNRAALVSIGVKAADVIGKPAEIVFSAWPDLLAMFKGVEQAKTELMVNVRGEERYFEIGISPLHDGGDEIIGRVFIVRDITEHTELQRNLQQLNAELEQRVRRRTVALQEALRQEKAMHFQLMQTERLAVAGRLLASVSHELNNPLQAIHNALFLIKDETNLSDQGRQDVDIILSETERMAALIERLRLLYKPVREKDFQLVELNNLVEDIYTLITTHLRQKEISFEFDPDPDLPGILGIPDQLKQVLLNLFLNAAEAMPLKGHLVVQTETLSAENEVMITVKDTGPGIDPELLPNIFTPFITNKDTGTGLGLAISHDIIQQHLGHIEANNDPQGGAVFRIWLPVQKKVLS
jgi:PAS domain S-box-containing protein